MNTTLTIQESATLISKGVNAERATRMPLCATSADEPHWSEPIFTLADLIALLPKGIKAGNCECSLNIIALDNGNWCASYLSYCGGEVDYEFYESTGSELIDVLFELVCNLIDNHVELN